MYVYIYVCIYICMYIYMYIYIYMYRLCKNDFKYSKFAKVLLLEISMHSGDARNALPSVVNPLDCT